MGKPIGMGSVHIKAKLYLQNDAYYTTLFSEAGFDSGVELGDKQKYIGIFKQYMNEMLTPASLRLYNERIEELHYIMDDSHLQDSSWAAKTAYMNINNGKDKDLANHRIPLPSIKDVVNKR